MTVQSVPRISIYIRAQESTQPNTKIYKGITILTTNESLREQIQTIDEEKKFQACQLENMITEVNYIIMTLRNSTKPDPMTDDELAQSLQKEIQDLKAIYFENI